jgi:RNA polymerase sigma-70 factor (ECF subfamily)
VNYEPRLTDADLAGAACRGDERAFAAIMRRHKTWLYRFIRRYVANRDDAYDVLQDTFVSAWSAIGRYDRVRPLEAWLRRIALNKCRDRGRRNAVKRAAQQFLATAWFAQEEVAAPDANPAPNAALKHLEDAIARLPRQLKEPLVLTVLEGLSQKDAGQLLGINAKAVETRVYRAKQRLATLLDPSDLSDLLDSE